MPLPRSAVYLAGGAAALLLAWLSLTGWRAATPTSPLADVREEAAHPPASFVEEQLLTADHMDAAEVGDVAPVLPVDLSAPSAAEAWLRAELAKPVETPDLPHEPPVSGPQSLPPRFGDKPDRRQRSEICSQRAEQALEWIARQLRREGGWSFVDGEGEPAAKVTDAWATPRRSATAATGLAMLPFLMVDQTHREGRFKDVLQSGVERLLAERAHNLEARRPPGDLRGEGGHLLSQAWATLALCECYGQSQDRQLETPSQDALNFLVESQHADGGFGAQPGQPGECLVTVWCLHALKAGHLAYLRIPPSSVAGAIRFLNAIQSEGGERYGATQPGDGDRACSAGGLLCRMYLGWKQDEPALTRGVARVLKDGPAADDAVCNFFATRAAWHLWGDTWDRWHGPMEAQLHRTQVQTGEQRGSWHTPDARVAWGGRLCETSLQALVLLTPYDPRHPRRQVEGDDF